MSVARRALLAILAIAVLAVLLPAAPASAAFKTKIIVSLEFPAFHGNLQSKNGSCLMDRKVKLFRKKNGKVKQLGTDVSDGAGNWAVPIGKKRLTSGFYFAKVTAHGECRGDKSNTLPIA